MKILFHVVLILSSTASLAQGSLHWDTLDAGTVNNIQDIYFHSPDTGYIVGDNYLFKKTTDGGQTWVDLPAPTQGERPGNNGRIIGMDHYSSSPVSSLDSGLYLFWEQLYHGVYTSDDGDNYTVFSDGDSNTLCHANGFSVLPRNQGNDYVALIVYGQSCSGNALFKNFYDGPFGIQVTDSVASATSASITSVDSDSFLYLYGLSDGHILRYHHVLWPPDTVFVHSSGVREVVNAGNHRWYATTNEDFDNMYVSTDSGKTFTLDTSFPSTFFFPKVNDFSFLDGDVGIAGAKGNGAYGIIMVRDSGNWALYTAQHPINAVKIFDNGVAYAAGDNGLIMKTGMLTGLNELDANSLSLRVHPNPVSELLYIGGLENLDVAAIELLDTQARIVARFKPADRALNVSDLSTGTYLLRVEAGGQILSERVIVQH